MSIKNLNVLLQPRSIALFGAEKNPASMGHVLARNIFSAGFDGPIIPVDDRFSAVEGVLTFRSIEDLPIVPDLAVFASPLAAVPEKIALLGERGTRAAIVLSTDSLHDDKVEKEAHHQRLLEAARPHGLRIVGPACFGVMVPDHGLNASWAHTQPKAGDLAFVTHSGTISAMMLEWAVPRGVGFSLVAGLGDMLDVDFGDLLDYLAFDPETRAILIYLERIGDVREFLSAARSAARLKPVIVFRPGDNANPSWSNDNRIDSNKAHRAAFRRAGILPVESLAELVAAARTLALGLRLTGDRLAVVSNGRGAATLAADAVRRRGGTLSTLGDGTREALDRILPTGWGRKNPINVFADASPQRYADVVETVLDDRDSDTLLLIHVPSPLTDAATAEAIASKLTGRHKPIVAVWPRIRDEHDLRELFGQHKVAVYDDAEEAVTACSQLMAYRRAQDMLMETPASVPEQFERDPESVHQIITEALAHARSQLTESETFAVLTAYGIACESTRFASSIEDAVTEAASIGFPVRIRAVLPAEPSGADEWGSAADLGSQEAVRNAIQRIERRAMQCYPEIPQLEFAISAMSSCGPTMALRLAMGIVPALGPILSFGATGSVAAVTGDRALALPPLNLALARHTMEETRVFRLLNGDGSSPPLATEDVALALVRLSHLVCDHPEIVRIVIDPLWASVDRVVAIDATIRVAATDAAASDRHLAIRPYPKELEKQIHTRKSKILDFRPIRPEDEPALQAFVRGMSPNDARMRFFSPLRELDHRFAAHLTQLDYDREMAFIAIDPDAADTSIWGVVRISADPDNLEAEFATAVRSDLKGEGLGQLMMQEILAYSAAHGIGEVWGSVLAENAPMLGLSRKLGFEVSADRNDPGVMKVRKRLN